ncbi:hypothetical protein C8J56DRAFT_896247 [Mycena floridula]|nr:hypothetical protein C8J56DRAFT_896247 [Mycena floridula]
MILLAVCRSKLCWWVSLAIFLTVIRHFCGWHFSLFLQHLPHPWVTSQALALVLTQTSFKKKTFAEIQAPEVILDAATPFTAFDVVSDILISVALCILLYIWESVWDIRMHEIN